MLTTEDFKRAYAHKRRVAALKALPAKLAWKTLGLLLGAMLGWLAIGGIIALDPTFAEVPRATVAAQPATPVEASQGIASGTDYASAYADCAVHGWDAGTVNACRWAAAMHFGGQHDLYYYIHHTTTGA